MYTEHGAIEEEGKKVIEKINNITACFNRISEKVKESSKDTYAREFLNFTILQKQYEAQKFLLKIEHVLPSNQNKVATNYLLLFSQITKLKQVLKEDSNVYER